MLPIDTVIKLLDAGFTVDDIRAYNSAEVPNPAPVPAQEPAIQNPPVNPPVNVPTPTPTPTNQNTDTNTDVLNALRELTNTIRANAIIGSNIAQPRGTAELAADALAKIMNPYDEGGK